ncbi:MAG: hypothetical protein LBG89_01685 [Rickettsiales bacterium]|jgi:hypothetical protein|nr:hypothetical protein [Rickettsiales bacterium]
MSQYTNEINEIIGLDSKKEAKKIKSERAKVMLQIAEDKKTRANLVKKALAAQQAAFGAGGSSGLSASDAAVLKRIEEEAGAGMDDKIAKGESRLSGLRNPKDRRAKNLLRSLLKHLGTGM